MNAGRGTSVPVNKLSNRAGASNVWRSGSPYAARRTAPVNTTATIGELPEVWYRYGDSNPGPVAENHVS